jgi:hypothetical protein
MSLRESRLEAGGGEKRRRITTKTKKLRFLPTDGTPSGVAYVNSGA